MAAQPQWTQIAEFSLDQLLELNYKSKVSVLGEQVKIYFTQPLLINAR